MIPTLGKTRSSRGAFGAFGNTMIRGQAESTVATADQVARILSEAEAARRQGNWALWARLTAQAASVAASSASAGLPGGPSSRGPTTASGESVLMTRDGPIYTVGPTWTGTSTSDPSRKPITPTADESPWVQPKSLLGTGVAVAAGLGLLLWGASALKTYRQRRTVQRRLAA